MTRPIAVIDADILILLLDDSTDADVERRRGFAEITIERLQKQNARFVVPAPAVAELCRDRSGADAIREIVRDVISRLRIEVLDEDAAVVAGEISRTTLQSREGRERGAVKFDALIAAVAHRINARWLLTGNAKHLRRCISAIQSNVEVVEASEPSTTGQQVMLQVMKPPKVGAT